MIGLCFIAFPIAYADILYLPKSWATLFAIYPYDVTYPYGIC